MAKSQAWKKRRKLEREGSRNPELNRGSWHGVVPVERTTPTLHEKQRRFMDKHKKKWNRTLPPDSDGSIFYYSPAAPAFGLIQYRFRSDAASHTGRCRRCPHPQSVPQA